MLYISLQASGVWQINGWIWSGRWHLIDLLGEARGDYGQALQSYCPKANITFILFAMFRAIVRSSRQYDQEICLKEKCCLFSFVAVDNRIFFKQSLILI